MSIPMEDPTLIIFVPGINIMPLTPDDPAAIEVAAVVLAPAPVLAQAADEPAAARRIPMGKQIGKKYSKRAKTGG